ncbi:hypothetical protein MMC10_009402 [Thelotrema lepadinum]|nr:hypothetical protein [Thelotrema lepadinum]
MQTFLILTAIGLSTLSALANAQAVCSAPNGSGLSVNNINGICCVGAITADSTGAQACCVSGFEVDTTGADGETTSVSVTGCSTIINLTASDYTSVAFGGGATSTSASASAAATTSAGVTSTGTGTASAPTSTVVSSGTGSVSSGSFPTTSSRSSSSSSKAGAAPAIVTQGPVLALAGLAACGAVLL